jgi:hypothetical protein
MLLSLAAGLCGCGIDVTYADGAAAAAPSQTSSEPVTPSPSPSPSPSASPSADPSSDPSDDLSADTSDDPTTDTSDDPSADTSDGASQDGTVTMPEASADPSGGASPQASSSPPSGQAELVPYDGIVEHLFFHPIIAYPELAFDGDAKTEGLDSYMVTVSEYNMMLESIYDKGYILVDMNDVWSETVGDDGVHRMVRSTLMIPEGKKPLILSFDDTNYYNYMIENGFPYKLVIQDGELWSYGLDPDGNEVYSQDLDAITILDKFVKEHPDFSLNGAKGCLCLTGYEGILGYRTMTDTHGMTADMEEARQKEIVAVKPIVTMLKETGWYFGSHSWGHISLSTSNLKTVKEDMSRWLNEVGSLVGSTKLFFYPFGARPDGDDVQQSGEIFKYLQAKGFRVFASVGYESYSKIKSDICAVICDRMHADGDTLRRSRERYLKFYDAKLVFDYDVRPDYGNSWA